MVHGALAMLQELVILRDFDKPSLAEEFKQIEECVEKIQSLFGQLDQVNRSIDEAAKENERLSIQAASPLEELHGARYCGAPYFAAMAALRAGADLVNVICDESAAVPIKTFSPDLIVYPLLSATGNIDRAAATKLLERVDAVIVGPGLSRSENLIKAAYSLASMAATNRSILIFDGDGIRLLEKPLKSARRIIITPNIREYAWLCSVHGLSPDDDASLSLLSDRLNACILKKAAFDIICCGSIQKTVEAEGIERRCGGQGDLLAGSVGTFAVWSCKRGYEDSNLVDACDSASRLVRKAAQLAFHEHSRSVVTQDMLSFIGRAFSILYSNSR